MERQEFLKTLGISFAAVCVGSCISACGKSDEATPATPAPPAGSFVTVNLSDLSVIGPPKLKDGVAFFRTADGDLATSFLATESVCTHQGGALLWKQNLNSIECQRHGAQFSADGVNTKVPQAPGNARNLKTYAITVANGVVSAKIA